MQFESTPVVDAISQISFTGNTIPRNWFKHIKMPDGKPDSIGIILLSEIIYWYRLADVIDKPSNTVIGKEKKFHADKLQKSYSQLAKEFGFSKEQVRDAIKRLEAAGIITLELRTVITENGDKLTNVLFLEPVPNMVNTVTHTKVSNSVSVGIKVDTYGDKSGQVSGLKSIGMGIKPDTYTETTTETTTETENTNLQTTQIVSNSNIVSMAQQQAPKKERTKSIKTPCPQPFIVTVEMREWAEEHCPGIDLRAETQKLKDWALGKGERKADWIATWRNWIRRVYEINPPKKKKVSGMDITTPY